MYSDPEIPYNYYPEAIVAKGLKIVREFSRPIVENFYQRLLENPETAEYLSHKEVERHLKGSMAASSTA